MPVFDWYIDTRRQQPKPGRPKRNRKQVAAKRRSARRNRRR